MCILVTSFSILQHGLQVDDLFIIYYFQVNGGLEDTYLLPYYNHNISKF
jgi:hypothetical protein